MFNNGTLLSLSCRLEMYVHHILLLQVWTQSWSCLVHHILSLQLLGLVTSRDPEVSDLTGHLPMSETIDKIKHGTMFVMNY